MKKVFLILFLLATLPIRSEVSAKCDCNGNEIITVYQNGQTKRVNRSAQSDPNVFCVPCNLKLNSTLLEHPAVMKMIVPNGINMMTIVIV